MLTLSVFLKTIKKYANNISVSDEDFVREFFDYFIDGLDIKNKKGNLYYFEKSMISELMGQKQDVPAVIRGAVCHYNANHKIPSLMQDFMDNQMNHSRIESMLAELKNIINSDSTISQSAKETICNMGDIECISNIFVEAIKAPNTVLKEKRVLWQSGDSSLNVLLADIIRISFGDSKNKKIVVIPVNTTFETKLSSNAEEEIYPLVSENTIHGKWLANILQFVSKEDLDKRIEGYLSKIGTEPIGECVCPGGKSILYSIGDTVIIQHNDTIFYLLAISDFDEKNKAHSSAELIEKSIERLLEYYDDVGQGYELYLPLLGTGKSRAQLSSKASCDMIKNTVMKNSNIVNGIINIVVLEKMAHELF